MGEGTAGSKDRGSGFIPYSESRRQFLKEAGRVGIGAATTAGIAALAVEESKIGFIQKLLNSLSGAVGGGLDTLLQRPTEAQKKAARLLKETPDEQKDYYKVVDHKDIRLNRDTLNTRKEPNAHPGAPGLSLAGSLTINDPVHGAIDWPDDIDPQTGKANWVIFMQNGKPVFVAKRYLVIDADNQPARSPAAYTNQYWATPITEEHPVSPKKPK